MNGFEDSTEARSVAKAGAPLQTTGRQALLVASNGILDPSPVRLVKSSILRTSRPTRRYAGLNLYVASWRPGRSNEKLWAGVPVSITASPGDSISIEVHEGFFGLPWHGNIKILWN
jgi:hypothetical protein